MSNVDTSHNRRRRCWVYRVRGGLIVLLMFLSACEQATSPTSPTSPKDDAEHPSNVIYLGYDDLDTLALAARTVDATVEDTLATLHIATLTLAAEHTTNGTIDVAVTTLASLPGVRYAERDQPRSFAPVRGGMSAQRMAEQWYLDAIGLAEDWSGPGGAGVVVAISDSGIDPSHPDLSGQIVTGYDALTGTELTVDTSVVPEDGHGSHVAGTVAADGQIRGVAPDASLMPIRIFAPSYVGDFKAAQALVWAVDNGADLINASWGGAGYSQTLAEAINYALERGVAVVASAGNGGSSLPNYPAAYPGVIAVGAHNPAGNVSLFSNQGPHVITYAPGERVLSTLPNESYAYWDGTSMAAPLVTGALALVLETRGSLSPYQLRALLPERLHVAPLLEGEIGVAGGCFVVDVRDSGGEVVGGVDIALLRDDVQYWQLSNGRGRATFREIAPGAYTLQVTAPAAIEEGLDPTARVLLERPVSVGLTCDVALPVVMRSALSLTLRWERGDLDLAIKEGNFLWTTSKEGARFGLFGDDATDGGEESYRYLGGLPAATVRWGVYNPTGTSQTVTLETVENGTARALSVEVPPRQPPEAPFELGDMRVLTRP